MLSKLELYIKAQFRVRLCKLSATASYYVQRLLPNSGKVSSKHYATDPADFMDTYLKIRLEAKEILSNLSQFNDASEGNCLGSNAGCI